MFNTTGMISFDFDFQSSGTISAYNNRHGKSKINQHNSRYTIFDYKSWKRSDQLCQCWLKNLKLYVYDITLSKTLPSTLCLSSISGLLARNRHVIVNSVRSERPRRIRFWSWRQPTRNFSTWTCARKKRQQQRYSWFRLSWMIITARTIEDVVFEWGEALTD